MLCAILQDYPASNLDTFNNEAMALAARGVTIMVSSGDNGANGMSDCTCNENSGSDSLDYPTAGDETWSGKGYFPSFPATSPYGEFNYILVVLNRALNSALNRACHSFFRSL